MRDSVQFHDRLLGVYCCQHVFERERQVLLVGHQEGDWQFVCGSTDHDYDDDLYHVSVGVLLDFDSSLNEIADLPDNWEAERQQVGDPWMRTRCGANDA